MNRIDAAPVASMPLTNDRDGFRSEGPVPISGRNDLWMNLAKPSADVGRKTVQDLLRHANSRITLDVYTQAVNATKRAAQSRL